MTKKQLKALDAQLSAAYKKHGDRVQVPIMSLSKIFDESKAAVLAGGDVDASMIEAITRHRVN